MAQIWFLLAWFLSCSVAGSIFSRKLLVPHPNNDLKPEESEDAVQQLPIDYQLLLPTQHQVQLDQNDYVPQPQLLYYYLPHSNNNNYKEIIYSAQENDPNGWIGTHSMPFNKEDEKKLFYNVMYVDQNELHNYANYGYNVKPVDERIENDLQYDFRTNTHLAD